MKRAIRTIILKIPLAKPLYHAVKQRWKTWIVMPIRKRMTAFWRTSPFYMPKALWVEASTLCQLRCTGCGFQRNNHRALGAGYLTFQNFKKLVDDNPQVKRIELSNYGEIFLNPELVSIMKYAQEKGVRLTAYNGVNFNTVSDEQLKALVDYGFEGMVVSIDGASNETYVKYRVGGNFERVIDNIRMLLAYREAKGSKYPKVKWKYIIMQHNELEVAKAKQMAKELGIPIKFSLDWDKNYKPTHVDFLKRETGLTSLTQKEYTEEAKESWCGDVICNNMILAPQINWDGRLLGCCSYSTGDYGVNVFEVGLKKALHSKLYVKSKKCLLKVHPREDVYGDSPCYNCNSRLVRERNGRCLKLRMGDFL